MKLITEENQLAILLDLLNIKGPECINVVDLVNYWRDNVNLLESKYNQYYYYVVLLSLSRYLFSPVLQILIILR